MIVVSYSKSFEFTTKSILVRSFFEEWKKRKKRKVKIIERQIGQVQTRSNLFELVRTCSKSFARRARRSYGQRWHDTVRKTPFFHRETSESKRNESLHNCSGRRVGKLVNWWLMSLGEKKRRRWSTIVASARDLTPVSRALWSPCREKMRCRRW